VLSNHPDSELGEDEDMVDEEDAVDELVEDMDQDIYD
jgi:hypothetical protein